MANRTEETLPQTQNDNGEQSRNKQKNKKKKMNAKNVKKLMGHIRKVTLWLDQHPSLPLGIGYEVVSGLIPVIVDFFGLFASLYLFFLSCRFGLPYSIKIRMFLNIFFDWLLGITLILGDALDAYFKANLRNLKLLERHVDRDQLLIDDVTITSQQSRHVVPWFHKLGRHSVSVLLIA
ncbi:hypothetical protein K7432_008056 [Basidiobolus ranarum]|uniref:DUF4112 domain-containing protein n=1 Tax=Basidiobolus ranarum TaxID=34480 RepID=A0ABR2WSF6_9FUNG